MHKKDNTHPANILKCILVLCTLLLTVFKLKTNDIWTLMIGGKIWLQKPTLRFLDEVSFSVSGIPWVNQEWLGEILLYLIYSQGGAVALITLKALLICSMLLMIFKHMQDRGANVYVIFWVLFVTVFLCRFRFTVRPQVISFVFITLLAQWLWEYKVGKRQHLWFVVPIVFVWTNIHFGSLIGLILIGIYLFAALLACYVPRFFDGNLTHPTTKDTVKHLALVLGASALVAMINPATYQYYTMPLEAAYLSVKYRVLECLPPRVLTFWVFPLFWTTLAAYTVIVFSTIRKMDIYNLMLFLITAALALKMTRFIALFGILCAPVIIQQVSEFLKAKIFPDRVTRLATNHILMILICFGLVGCMLKSNHPLLKKFQLGVGINQNLQPVGAVNFLKNNKIHGNIFNDINWGGYLSFHLHPDNKIFMNSRYTIFGDIIYETYYRVLSGVDEWEQILNQYNTDIVLLSKKLATKSRLMAYLSNSSQWSMVYLDDISFVFIKNKREFREIIQIFNYNVDVQVAK